ncbi:MAG: adenine deaminase [Bacteroidota bacterium]|nr:adenine deaminase [Bacteroidota bacterium]
MTEYSSENIVEGNIIDVINRRIYKGSIRVENGRISEISENRNLDSDKYILPGFIDSHIHIESSMLTPSEFARLAVVHGTVATVSDPHEIANVLGVEGVEFMIKNGEEIPFKFYFGAPSCVPATGFETSGAEISLDDINELIYNPKIKYLSEMMNFPGVIYDSPDVMKKIEFAKNAEIYQDGKLVKTGKPIDGHAPGLRGEALRKYIAAGITTDHETFELDEALEKISLGMKISIREGSAAKNFNALHKLIQTNPNMCMFCSDDKHPDDLAAGHINLLVRRALALGYDLFDVLRIASLNPAEHYSLDVGLLRIGDDADFIIVDNLNDFNIVETYIQGKKAAEAGKSLINSVKVLPVNKFNCEPKKASDFYLQPKGGKIRVISAIEGQLITDSLLEEEFIENGCLVSNIENDILKITVVNRYFNAPPALGFIKGFGLKKGAIASSVGHDSHNIIAVGVTDEDIAEAVNTVIEAKGGMVVNNGNSVEILPLPIAGLMTSEDGYETAEKYSKLNSIAKSLGTTMNAPFMTLSFMALLVIPKLKLSDRGLFDGEKFEFVGLYA